ncbi:hypothetical protein Golob_003912 [Gossypium lobatum]|uniref:Uncharacterized protein n=1 Tax=Gossypium lobatum TaxID=34289 RepID=A0A7J8N001_9ROSI|nr:hypothetical protein [Gossypium lobatum]
MANLNTPILVDDFNEYEIALKFQKSTTSKYVKNFKCTFSYLVGSFNVSDNDPVNSSLHQLNVNSADLEGEYDKSDDYNRYLSESNTTSEKSKLNIYLEELELELNSQIDVLDYWSKTSI